ncbi:hypothetical protein FNF29_03428 [Cafeteria roenbergensis]|uniref:Centrosomal protein of 76 kDa n=1 Tax=Cafeteria roenbergensis TaxID=33653 RepID=A0A5A8DYA4_CAFRO|nr:hypothetical protein FNF29_03428 [Cafeteria roenbergensis]KAA0168721.1 hypothetical protein FNF28_02458 [Cafeteria roenbergensis]|eukprot:KAA0152904.1 hypothetical protein FNF29_03428 [Cafeteria roenbergensis]
MAAEALRDQVHGYLQSQGVYDEVRAVLREREAELGSAALAGMSQAEKVRHVLREAGVVDAVVNGLASGVEPPHGQATSHTGRSKDGKQSPSAAEADAGRSSLSGGLGGDGDAADAALGGNGSGSGSGGLAFSDDKDKDEDEDLVSLAALAAACSADLSLRQGDGPRPLDPRRKYLRIHVQAGSAFLSDMAPDQDDGGRSAASAASAGSTGLRTAARPRAETSFLVLHACFRGQRFRGIPVPASESPSFDAAFLLDLFPSLDAVPPGGGLRRLMASADPLQLAVTRIVATGPQAAAVGRGSAGAAEPTAAAAASAGLPAGLGELGGTAFRVELVSYVCVEWRRVLATGSASLTVELPAAGTAGEAGLSAGDGWDPESAWSPDAEFDEPDTAPWHSPFTVLAMRSGTAADHATLLCSLLRGFGLDAFVAVGTWVDARGVEGTHEWVVSLDDRSLDDAAGGAGEQEGGLVVRFWEPLTGERSAPDWPTADGRRFRTIACLFNEESLLANVQPTSSVSGCSWALRDEGKWLPFDQGAIGALAATLPPAPALCPPTVAEGPLAFALEQCLRAEALAWREEAALPEAPFDPRLEHSLAPALAAYESERLTGRPFGADDFRAAVRACVPPGHSFSAFPFQVGHASPARLAAFLRASAVAEGVVCSRREAVSLAVRVRVFAYAEDVLAVWVIVACRCA